MASKSTNKVAYYYRAKNTANSSAFDLQTKFSDARKRKPTCEESEVPLAEGDVIRVQHYKARGGNELVHLVRYVPGEKTKTIQPKVKSAEENETAQAASNGKEFKDGDCFFLLNNSHILFTSHGISLPKAIVYLKRYFQAANLPKSALDFELSPACRLDKVKLINKHGVRSLELSASAYYASINEVNRKSWTKSLFSAAVNEVKALVEKDDSISELKAMEDLLINVEIRLDGNNGATMDAKKAIERLTENTIKSDDELFQGFTIVTRKDECITPNDIKLKKSFDVRKEDKSVNHLDVWAEMENFMNELTNTNLLEQ